jgi:hypothetical protein
MIRFAGKSVSIVVDLRRVRPGEPALLYAVQAAWNGSALFRRQLLDHMSV